MILIASQGTAVFYYAFRSPGYSHIYSWFLVCLSMWCWSRGLTGSSDRASGWLFRITCAWLVLIRPLDILLVLAFYGLAISTEGKAVLRTRWLTGQVLVGLVLAIPQMIYWKAAYGSWIFFSYKGEGFVNYDSPYLFQTLLAPKSGWLPYAPGFLLLPIACWSIRKRQRTVMTISVALFLLYWYAVSSWSDPGFGCSFGQRSFVQTVPFLTLVLWIAVHVNWPARRWAIVSIALPFIGLALINHMHAHLFDTCYWSDTWDWDQYLTGIGKVLK